MTYTDWPIAAWSRLLLFGITKFHANVLTLLWISCRVVIYSQTFPYLTGVKIIHSAVEMVCLLSSPTPPPTLNPNGSR